MEDTCFNQATTDLFQTITIIKWNIAERTRQLQRIIYILPRHIARLKVGRSQKRSEFKAVNSILCQYLYQIRLFQKWHRSVRHVQSGPSFYFLLVKGQLSLGAALICAHLLTAISMEPISRTKSVRVVSVHPYAKRTHLATTLHGPITW